jgi:hypothetical protein
MLRVTSNSSRDGPTTNRGDRIAASNKAALRADKSFRRDNGLHARKCESARRGTARDSAQGPRQEKARQAGDGQDPRERAHRAAAAWDTIEEVAESLRERGLSITTPTLKNYLQRTKSETDKRSKASRRSVRPTATRAPKAVGAGTPAPATHGRATPEAPVMGQPPTAKTEAPVTTATEAGALRGGKSAFLIKDKDSY